MGIQERREREKSERRRTILNCARELILQRGVERVNMEDIAKKAELSKATLYLYFSGKEIIFNEICEESARTFLEHFEPYLQTGVTGTKALIHFWNGFVNLFGNSDDIVIVFRVRNFLYPGQPFVSIQEFSANSQSEDSAGDDSKVQKQSKSPYVDAIISAMKNIIDQCKTEGVFDPKLDSQMATRLLLSIFSISVDNAVRLSVEINKPMLLIEEMRKIFQVIINGFAKEGIDRDCLDISKTIKPEVTG